MDMAKAGSGGRIRGRRVQSSLLLATVLLVAVPWSATAQLEEPIDGMSVPTTLPKVLVGGGGPEGGLNPPGGGGSTPTTTPTTTPPTTASAPTETTRALPGSTTTESKEAPASSSRRSRSTRPRSTNVPDPAAPATLVERASIDTPAAPAITRLRRVTVPAARQFGFPLGLAVLVLAFLAVQSRLDARDPKLAAAPITVDDDLLPFA